MSQQKEHFKSSIDFLSLCLLFFITGIPASIIFFLLWFITFPLKSNLKDNVAREFYLYLSYSTLSFCLTVIWVHAAAAKSLQSCPALCDPIDSSPLGSSVPGILQARILEWVAISFFNAWKLKVKVKSLSCAQLFATPWTAAHQAPPSMGFSRQEYWSGVPLPSPNWVHTME